MIRTAAVEVKVLRMSILPEAFYQATALAPAQATNGMAGPEVSVPVSM